MSIEFYQRKSARYTVYLLHNQGDSFASNWQEFACSKAARKEYEKLKRYDNTIEVALYQGTYCLETFNPRIEQ